MGLLDQFNLDDPQTMGMLTAAAQMFQQSGPSLRPTSLGQIMGGGFGAYSQSMADSKKRKQEEDQFKQMMQMQALQQRSLTGELADKDLSRKQAMDAQEWYRNYNRTKMPSAGGEQAAGGSAADAARRSMMTMFPMQNPASSMQPTAQQATPGAQGGDASSIFQERLAEASAMRRSGIPALIQKADDIEKQALAFREEYSTTPQKMTGPDGKLGNYQLSKYGSPARNVGLGSAPDMVEMDLGGVKQWIDKNSVAGGQQFRKTVGPDAIYSGGITMRGQDMTDDRARDLNKITNSNKVSTTSTDLRKEFEGLPEVKNYKQALPAFTAINDAAKRNTPMADINLVYGIAKLYDPTSVVREGEYNTVANSPNIPERVKGWAQYLAGGGKLTPQVKAQIQQEAAGRMKSFEEPFKAARANYSDIAGRSGGDASLLFPTEYKTPIVANPQQPTLKSAIKGQVMDGYRFKGGNAADEANWEKL